MKLDGIVIIWWLDLATQQSESSKEALFGEEDADWSLTHMQATLTIKKAMSWAFKTEAEEI